MGRDPLDRLFRRFRERGDVSALAEIFDQAAPEMLRVARHVASRSVEPQDLVQTAFLVAIERADTYDSSRPVKAWLLGILTKEAAYERRKASRVVEPDRLEQREADTPDDAVSDGELRQAVNAALGSLPEKYRAVVAPAILDGVNPGEIARAVGERPGTVRVQLHRGLRLLREALPAGFALGAAITTASMGMGQVRMKVLLGASESAGRLGKGAGVGVGSGGVLAWVAARWPLVGGVAAVAIVGGGWALLSGEGGRATDADPLAVRTVADGTSSREESTAGDAREQVAAGSRGTTPAVEEVEVILFGRTLGMNLLPLEGVELTLRAGAQTFSSRSGAGGEYRLSLSVPMGTALRGGLHAAGPDGRAEVLGLTVRADGPSALYLGSLSLGEATPVTVRVLDETGREVEGAEVRVLVTSARIPGGLVRTGADGRGVVRNVPRAPIEVVAVAAGRMGVASFAETRARKREIVVRLGAGTVSAPGADPPRAARDERTELVVRMHSGGRPIWSPGEVEFLRTSSPSEVRANGDGEFSVRFDDAEPGAEVTLAIEVAGFQPTAQRVLLWTAPLTVVDVELDPEVSLVADVAHGPVILPILELQRWDDDVAAWSPSSLDWGGLMVANTLDGRFRFDGLTPGEYRLRDQKSGLHTEGVTVGADAGMVSAQLDLTVLQRVQGRVYVPDPELLHDVRVLVQAPGLDLAVNRRTPQQRFQYVIQVDADGRFGVRIPTDRPVRFAAQHPLLVSTGWVELKDANSEVALELARGTELRLPLTALAGRELDQVRVLLYPDEPAGEPHACLYPLVEDAVARFAGMPPGPWTLWVDPGAETRVRPTVLRGVAASGEATVLAEPFFERGSSVRLRFSSSERPEVRVAAFARSHGEPSYVRTATAAPGEALVLEGLGAGRFSIVVSAQSAPGPLLETVLEVDGEREFELQVERP
jgi:RNA polymerase sigma-70 factor (ECF subfamily)